MRILNDKEMQEIEGGFNFFSIFSLTNPTSNQKTSQVEKEKDPFLANMKKMFGASAGRDLAKLAQHYKLVSLVNAFMGW